ncbi:tetratricopeptide repeat protein [Curtobacterium aurantiacum]|uniref:Tetratricopeptide repeat protein n=1 Tax=Curtobacterium aurantiacum TaxID=3236919 RepID=A0ABS5VBA3_9MICO|nr:tetratricopeptide repeat protein [Curtobacterium flaccumfaciens]MBT1544103.1 tetratricopeptide repeat protein [Curtobacterium flaccumfaciens pv. flaccumfaciens]MBT1586736.1 tetratricopeptide repeat protein [Curtobacterium flaccumfaciens pv. flaccumfaciens]
MERAGRRIRSPFWGAALMAVLLALYIGLVGHRAVAFIATGVPIGIAIGVALFVVAAIGALLLVLEFRFGIRITRLGARLEAEGGAPEDVVPVRPSGRPVRDAADELFPQYRDAVEQDPTDWRAWYRLGVVYDAAGDRKRARAAMRTALARAAGR